MNLRIDPRLLAAPASTPIRMRFGQRDRVTVRGLPLRYLRETEDGRGHLFERCDAPTICVSHDHADLWRARSEPGFRYDPDFFAEGADDVRRRAAVEAFGEIPRDEQELIGWKLRMCEGVRSLQEERRERLAAGGRERDPDAPDDEVLRVSLSDAGLTVAFAIMERRERERAKAERAKAKADGAVVGRAPRGGKVVAAKARPGFKALRKWYRALREGGWDPRVLRMGYHRCGSRDHKVSDDVEALMARHAARYASANRPTKAQLYAELVAAVEDHNGALPAGAEAVAPPSRDTFYRRIRAMNAFVVHCARFGEKSAQARFRPISAGVGATIPGERVEIDEWNVQLHVLLVWNGMWDELTEEEKEVVRRVRVWVCIAIDCATRAILALAVSETPSTDAALAVLRMVVSDKTAYSDGVGAKCPWTMAVRPKTIVTDAGATFLSDRFRAAAAALGIDNVTAIAGKPSMRGTEERFNSTLHVGLIGQFSGRTFENVVAKGDYPSQRRASLTLPGLLWALVRFTTDRYHLTPHAGLGGQMPAKAWEELTALYGVAPLPGRDELRNVFGVDLRRRTGPRGVRLLGLHYQGEALQEHRRRHGDAEADVRYDPADIGAVSVRLGDAWHAVECVTPGFDGVSMGDWRLAAAALRKRYGQEAALAQPVVNQAVREIRDLAKRSLEVVGLGSETPTQDVVDRVERDMLIGFRMPERDEAGPMPDPFADLPQGGPGPDGPPPPEAAAAAATDGAAPQTPAKRRPLRFRKD